MLEIVQQIDWLLLLRIIGNISIAGGIFFTLSAGIGMIRMPDFYTRLHPAGVMDSMGAPLILIGLALHSETPLIAFKIVLLVVFLLITGPTACHALAKAALGSGIKPKRISHEGKK